MKKLLIATTLATTIALAGCATGDLTSSAINAAYVFDQNGSIQSQILSANLSQDEVNTVASAFTKIQALRNKIEIEKNFLSLTLDYEQAKIAYLSIELVVGRHINDYTEAQKLLFKDIQLTAKELDKSMQNAVSQSQIVGYLNTAAQLAVLIK